MKITVSLNKDQYLRIFGPASLLVTKGEIRILGASFTQNSRIIISKFRSYCVKAVTESEIDVFLGEGALIQEPQPGEEVIDEWEKAVNEVLDNLTKPGIIVIIGPVDSGKSSLTAMVANIALSKGLKPAIIDGDIGQADIGPPTFISLSIIDKPILWLRELTYNKIRFIGTITPSHVAHRVITAIKSLVDEALKQSDVVIIDTDGWIYGSQAIEYKIDLIRHINPQALFMVGEEIKILLNTFRKYMQVKFLPSPKVMKKRDREERRILRCHAYKRYLEKSTIRTFPLDKSIIIGSYILNGEPLNLSEDLLNRIKEAIGCNVVYVSKLYEGSYAVVISGSRNRYVYEKLREVLNASEVFVLQSGEEKGIISCVLNEKLEEVAPAIIEKIDYEKKVIYVRTPWRGDIGGLIIGKVKLNEQWEEVLRGDKCLL